MKQRFIYTFLSVFGFISTSVAQPKETTLAKITYDSTQRDQPKKEQWALYLGQHSSLYRSVNQERLLKHVFRMCGGDANDIKGANDALRDSPAEIHSINVKKRYAVNEIVASQFLLTDDLLAIDWEIGEETKEIGDYTMQKATAHFKGRDYTAWFAAELPFPFGPWKLHGLPGLILEAEDSSGEVVFSFVGFESIDDQEYPIAVSAKAKPISQKEYDKVWEAYVKNPQAFAAAATASRGEGEVVTLLGTRSASVGSAESRPKVFNNTLELPEKP